MPPICCQSPPELAGLALRQPLAAVPLLHGRWLEETGSDEEWDRDRELPGHEAAP